MFLCHIAISCSCSCSYFNSFSCFTSNSCFMNIFIHISFPILSLFHASYIWHFIDLYRNTYTCTCPHHRHLLIQCDAYIFTHHSCILSLYESILLRNWNHSNWIIQTQVMAFSCQLVDLSGQFEIFISSALYLYLTLVLYTPLNLRC